MYFWVLYWRQKYDEKQIDENTDHRSQKYNGGDFTGIRKDKNSNTLQYQ